LVSFLAFLPVMFREATRAPDLAGIARRSAFNPGSTMSAMDFEVSPG
jgi:hypothetical protein